MADKIPPKQNTKPPTHAVLKNQTPPPSPSLPKRSDTRQDQSTVTDPTPTPKVNSPVTAKHMLTKKESQVLSENSRPGSPALRKVMKPRDPSTSRAFNTIAVPENTFINPVTQARFEDPVVLSDGNSYDRSALIAMAAPKHTELDATFWNQNPVNRLLIALQESFHRDDTCTVDESLLNCPITLTPFKEPVITIPGGHTFEKDALVKALHGSLYGKCPLTKEPIRGFRANHAILHIVNQTSLKSDTPANFDDVEEKSRLLQYFWEELDKFRTDSA
tara:strand:- start:515 stop:1339 length:825 start_codon:yes stop_codon:yes gene_type:complete